MYILLVCIGSPTFSQNKKDIDQILEQYHTYKNTNLVKALELANQAVRMSELENDSLYIMKSYHYLGAALYKQRKIDLTKNAIDRSLVISELKNDPEFMASNYLYSANIARRKNKYDKSFEFIEKAMTIAQQQNLMDLVFKITISKSVLLKRTKNYTSAHSLLKSVLKDKESVHDNTLASVYNSLGISYLKKDKDSSVFYYKKAMALCQKTGNTSLERKVAGNLADVLMVKKEFDKAFEYLTLAEQKAIESSDYAGSHYVNATLGVYYENQQQFDKAVEKYQKAIDDYGMYVDDNQRAHIYWLLSAALWFNQQYKEGFEIQEKYILLKDSLFTVEKNNTFEKLQTEYEVEKKNQQIQFLEKEQQLEAKQKNLIIGIGGLILTALILMVFLYRYRVQSQKIIRKQEQQLHLQEKQQLEQLQKIKRIESFIAGEEKEKNRIAEELHDGIGAQLSGIKHFASALPTSDNAEALLGSISAVSKDIRLLSHSLSSGYGLEQPLDQLLKTLRVQYQNHFYIQVHLFPEEDIKNISTTQKLFLYRTIQELVNNVYKYAKAKQVQISITLSEDIVLIVEDDGVGFDKTIKAKGIGLLNIKERVKNLEGEFVLDTTPGRGSSILIKVPKK